MELRRNFHKLCINNSNLLKSIFIYSEETLYAMSFRILFFSEIKLSRLQINTVYEGNQINIMGYSRSLIRSPIQE